MKTIEERIREAVGANASDEELAELAIAIYADIKNTITRAAMLQSYCQLRSTSAFDHDSALKVVTQGLEAVN